jgi:pyridinium-3,5-biscarboxylic acid mononucleotide sulfurtransferase
MVTGVAEPAGLAERLAALDCQLAELGSVVVAFSGGADSAFLLASAVRVLGPSRVLAVTARSASLPATELSAARTFAVSLGVTLRTADTQEMERAGYRANGGDRCYFCKAELVEVLSAIAAEAGFAAVITGTNADDARAGFRPGIAAAAERQARTPLLDAGLTKEQIRMASRALGLPTWDKPAAACLASRIAYGVEVSAERLARVERAEQLAHAALADAGVAVRDLRVRDLGDSARLEVDAAVVDQVRRLGGVSEGIRSAGFLAVDIDPAGFRSGAMNELLPNPELYRHVMSRPE